MDNWLSFISMISSFATLIGFLTLFVKFGREKGESIAYQKEMRKDIEENKKDINCLGSKVNQMEKENTRLISTISSDMGWIKSSLTDIKNDIKARNIQNERIC